MWSPTKSVKKHHLLEGNQGDKGTEKHAMQGLAGDYVVAVSYLLHWRATTKTGWRKEN